MLGALDVVGALHASGAKKLPAHLATGFPRPAWRKLVNIKAGTGRRVGCGSRSRFLSHSLPQTSLYRGLRPRQARKGAIPEHAARRMDSAYLPAASKTSTTKSVNPAACEIVFKIKVRRKDF